MEGVRDVGTGMQRRAIDRRGSTASFRLLLVSASFHGPAQGVEDGATIMRWEGAGSLNPVVVGGGAGGRRPANRPGQLARRPAGPSPGRTWPAVRGTGRRTGGEPAAGMLGPGPVPAATRTGPQARGRAGAGAGLSGRCGGWGRPGHRRRSWTCAADIICMYIYIYIIRGVVAKMDLRCRCVVCNYTRCLRTIIYSLA